MRPLRSSLPRGLYEVSTRVTGNELIAVPTKEVTDTILGVIAYGQRKHKVAIHAFVFLSNHYHMLVSAPDAPEMSEFMRFINTNIAGELNRINKRRGTLWARRFRSVPIAQDRATQVWRLRYILAHGVKENLVGRVEDWPGASSLPWLRDGTPLKGKWVNRTKLYYARRRKSYVERPGDFTTTLTVLLEVLPCWRDMPEQEWRRLVRDIIAELNAEADEKREATGIQPLGRAAVIAQDPFTRVHNKTGHAPSVLALEMTDYLAMREELRARREAWYEAAAVAMQVLAEDAGQGKRRLPAMFWRTLSL